MHSGYISTNFSWYEVEYSETAERLNIDNSVPPSLVDACQNTAVNMEFVRSILRSPIKVNSWYRGPQLQAQPQFINPTSQHPHGEAVDFVCPKFGDPVYICKKLMTIADSIKFDQLILEHTWVHISFASGPGAVARKQVLSLLANKKYAIGLTDLNGVAL